MATPVVTDEMVDRAARAMRANAYGVDEWERVAEHTKDDYWRKYARAALEAIARTVKS